MKANHSFRDLGLAAALSIVLTSPALAQDTPDASAAEAPSPAPPAMRVPANSIPALRQKLSTAYEAKDYATMLEAAEALHQQRPWNATYMAYLVVAYALTENRPKGYEMMLTMQQQGLSYDFNSTDDTQFLRGTEAYEYINDLMIRAGEPAGEARVEFTLPEALVLPTAIDWDPTREAFLVANAREGAVFRVKPDGETENLLAADEENGLWSLFGLEVDADNDRLWLTTAANPNFVGFKPEDAGRSALVEVRLSDMELLARYPVPADGRPHRLGDLALGADGSVFTVDTILPIVYRLDREQGRLQAYVASADSVSFRGMTASDDGKLLYVADHEMGIMALDLEARRAARVTGPETLNFGGIEGIEFWNGHLVIIQNGNPPQRILRLKLAEDRITVDGVSPLAVAQPFFNFPNYGTLLNGRLVFFADSHWVVGDQELEPVKVASTDVANAPELMAPDMDKFWDEYYEKQGIPRPDETRVQP
ncbi:MAG: hypothetical protein V2I57_12195 [Xanthomonadales bacterium]|jgi:streptogramin lyase|nr:hypothetical protein [Xanthomonadales bacterium]